MTSVEEPKLEIIYYPLTRFLYNHELDNGRLSYSCLGAKINHNGPRCIDDDFEIKIITQITRDKHNSGVNITSLHPTIRLHNFDQEAIIRCSLVNDKEESLSPWHQLTYADKTVEYYEKIVNWLLGYDAEFKTINIWMTPWEKLVADLRDQKMKEAEKSDESISQRDMDHLEKLAEKDAAELELKRCRLRFQAFEKIGNDFNPICDPVFSGSINCLSEISILLEGLHQFRLIFSHFDRSKYQNESTDFTNVYFFRSH